MKHKIAYAAAALFAIVACRDFATPPETQSPGAPTATAQAPAASVAPALTVMHGISTTCLSYKSELDEIDARVTAAPDSTALLEAQVELNAIVSDVCN